MTIADIAQALGDGAEKKLANGGWRTRCPLRERHKHGDVKPAFDINEGNDGKLLFYCRAGCPQPDVVDALKRQGLWPTINRNGGQSNNSARAVSDRNAGPKRDEQRKQRNGPPNGLTVAQLAVAKGFTPDFMRSLGLRDAIFDWYIGNRTVKQVPCVEIPYRSPQGEEVVTKRRFGLEKDDRFNSRSWPECQELIVYGQERLAEACAKGEADCHESESDCWTSWYYTRFAFAVPGAGAAKAISRDHVRDLRAISLFVQSDQGGDNFREGVLARLRELEFVGIVHIVRMPAGVKDINELHQRHLGDPGGFEVALNEQLESAETIDLGPTPLKFRYASEIEPKPVHWLWQDRVPRCKVALFFGDGGVGKSTITLDIASRVSRGVAFPDGTSCEIGSTLIFSAEDEEADTIVPRLIAAEADRTRIAIPRLTLETDNMVKDVKIPDHIANIERTIIETSAVLVIFDPLSSFFSRELSSNNEEDVRVVLMALKGVAERTGAAIIVIRHPNKGGSSNALYRSAGSVGIINAARSSYLFANEPDDKGKRIMMPVKENLAGAPSALAYKLVETEVETKRGITKVPRVEWIDCDVKWEANDLLGEHDEEERTSSKLGRAVQFLTDALRDGPKLITEIEADAAASGIKPRTLRRARESMKLGASKDDFTANWYWELPGAARREKGAAL